MSVLKTVEISARTLQIIFVGIALIVGALVFKNWLNNRDEAQNVSAYVDQSQQTGLATEAIGNRATDAAEAQDAKATDVIEHRTIITYQQEKLRNEDPEINDWSNGIIPVRLRDADAKARTANRSNDAGSGDETVKQAKTD